MLKIKKYKVGLVIVIIILVILGAYYHINKDEVVVEEAPLLISDNKQVEEKEEIGEVTSYQVDIKGEVKKPGVYTLEENSRIIDVIKKAGGLTNNADTYFTNLSKKVFDEMVIVIYNKEQINNIKKLLEEEQNIVDELNENQNNDAIIDVDEEETNLISINQGTKEDFMLLPGIGEKKAQDIINYREEHGPFQSLEDLKNVTGIGDSTFDQIKDYITL